MADGNSELDLAFASGLIDRRHADRAAVEPPLPVTVAPKPRPGGNGLEPVDGLVLDLSLGGAQVRGSFAEWSNGATVVIAGLDIRPVEGRIVARSRGTIHVEFTSDLSPRIG